MNPWSSRRGGWARCFVSSPALQGCVDLRIGTIEKLPYADQYFTKAFAMHSLYFWPSVEGGVRELWRVLAPDGVLILAVHLRRAGANRLDPSRYGLTEQQVEAVASTLESSGFRDVTIQTRKFRRRTVAAIIARRKPH